MKKGTKVKFTEKALRFFRSDWTWDGFTCAGIMKSKTDFYDAAVEFAIGHGAPYTAKVLSIDNYMGSALVEYRVGKRKSTGCHCLSDIKAVK